MTRAISERTVLPTPAPHTAPISTRPKRSQRLIGWVVHRYERAPAAVVGGTLHTQLAPADVRRLIFDGFFPQVPGDAEPLRGSRTGLHEMGLPYVNDPAITRHLAAFLKKHTPAGSAPRAILFNGGVFQPAALRERLVEVMRQWYHTPAAPWQPLVLTTPSLDSP